MLNMTEIKNAAKAAGNDSETLLAKNVALIERKIQYWASEGDYSIYRSEFFGSYEDGLAAARKVASDNPGISFHCKTNSHGVPYIKFTW